MEEKKSQKHFMMLDGFVKHHNRESNKFHQQPNATKLYFLFSIEAEMCVC